MNFKTLLPFCDIWQQEINARKSDICFFYSATENSIVATYQIYSRFLKNLTNRSLTPLRNILNVKDCTIDIPSFKQEYDYNKLASCVQFFDHIESVRYQLLSAQYSLFEEQYDGEKTLDYYDANMSVLGYSLLERDQKKRTYQTILPDMLEPLGVQADRALLYVKQLDMLFAKRDWQKGGLIHIGISKKYIPQLAYLSGIGGRPLTLTEDTSLTTFLDLYRPDYIFGFISKRAEKAYSRRA